MLLFVQMTDFSTRLRTQPVQARAARTVEHILASAAQLLDEVGYDSFNTNLLAEHADVRVRTIYRYFDDKQTIVLCLAEQMYERADQSLRKTLEILADPSQPWREAIDEVVADYFRTMSNTPGWVAIRRALVAVAGLDEIRRQAVTRHTGWLADALLARGIDATRPRAFAIAAAAFAAASAIITPAVRGNARQRKAIAEEMRILVHSYLAHYLD